MSFFKVNTSVIFPIFIAIIFFSVLSGCSVLNPHLNFGRVPMQGELSSTTGIQVAYDYADKVEKKYRDAANAQSKLQNTLALSLVPISASALYLGLTGSSDGTRKAITALGIGGASFYGLGSYTRNDLRKMIYYNAVSAIQCIKGKFRPFSIIEKVEFANFEKNLSNLESGVSKMTSYRVSCSASNKEQNELFETNFKTIVQNYQNLLNDGYTLRERIKEAPAQLSDMVDKIINEADKQIVKTEPKIETMLSILGNLSQSAASFSNRSSSETRYESVPELKKRLKSCNELDIELEKNEILSAQIDSFIKRINASILKFENVNECQLGISDVKLSISPDVDEFILQSGQTVQFAISTDNGIPQAYFVGSVDKNITIIKTVEGVNVVAAITRNKDDLSVTEMKLKISDGSGQKFKIITIKLPKENG